MTEARALIPLTAYARTSTDDQQNPGESLRWQLSRANALIVGRAEIVSVVHDTDVSRSVPWSRRPEAARLISQLADPNRGWTGIVVGEPQRAFGLRVKCRTSSLSSPTGAYSYGCPRSVARSIPIPKHTICSCQCSADSVEPSAIDCGSAFGPQ